ncbi:SSU ribosomal protein S9P [Mycena floridula]|nr:SSU ribosomal protein S9P [Mycena floridula]
MNVLRSPLVFLLRRTYSTRFRPFVPPAQYADLRQGPPRRWSVLNPRHEDEDVNVNRQQQMENGEEVVEMDKEMEEAVEQREQEEDNEEEDEDEEGQEVDEEVEGTPEKLEPPTASFYSVRDVFYDQLAELETAAKRVRNTLTVLDLLPLPDFALASLKPMRPMWKSVKEMEFEFTKLLSGAQHRKLIKVLDELHHYYRIATTAEYFELAENITNIIISFESSRGKMLEDAESRRKKVKFDTYGRSYTLGRRKTSSARVWMIAVHDPSKTLRPISEQDDDEDDEDEEEEEKEEEQVEKIEQEDDLDIVEDQSIDEDSIESIFGMDPDASGKMATASGPAIQTSTILVNNLPLAEYFPLVADRERVVRPLKLARLLGKYNVFTIVRGGGTTGQAGAIAHGISKALVAHDPSSEKILKAAKLTKRDPRMVERKKTGRAGARARYTWVKR